MAGNSYCTEQNRAKRVSFTKYYYSSELNGTIILIYFSWILIGISVTIKIKFNTLKLLLHCCANRKKKMTQFTATLR